MVLAQSLAARIVCRHTALLGRNHPTHFALSQGMLWAGILGTFAMAFGTAITVSVLASLAVSSRDWAARASGPSSVWAERIQTTAGFTGASLVFILGTVFFIASFRGPGPL